MKDKFTILSEVTNNGTESITTGVILECMEKYSVQFKTIRTTTGEEIIYDDENYWMLLKEKGEREDFEMKPIVKWLSKKVNPHVWNLQTAIEIGEIYIDDIAYKMPLKKAVMSSGDMVDWGVVDKQFKEHKIY